MRLARRRPPPPGADRWRLDDERQFLVRSLEDAEREHAAGDLSDDDYDALTRRDRARLAGVEESLALLGPEEPAAEDRLDEDGGDQARLDEDDVDHEGPGQATLSADGSPGHSGRRNRRRWWLVGVGVAAFVAGTALLVDRLASPQLPGQAISGTVQLNAAQQIRQELAQAAALTNEGTAGAQAQAAAIYRRVLAADPEQPQALAEMGWLEWGTGALTNKPKLVAAGKAMEEESLRVLPNDYAARLYLGTMLLKQGDASGASAQYRRALSEHPPSDALAAAAPFIRQAFASLGQPVPAGVPAG